MPIVRVPGILGGGPTIAGTRIGVANVIVALANALLYPEDARGSDPIACVLDAYPHLTEQDVRDTVDYYQGHRAETHANMLDDLEDGEGGPTSPKRWRPSLGGLHSSAAAQTDWLSHEGFPYRYPSRNAA